MLLLHEKAEQQSEVNSLAPLRQRLDVPQAFAHDPQQNRQHNILTSPLYIHTDDLSLNAISCSLYQHLTGTQHRGRHHFAQLDVDPLRCQFLQPEQLTVKEQYPSSTVLSLRSDVETRNIKRLTTDGCTSDWESS